MSESNPVYNPSEDDIKMIQEIMEWREKMLEPAPQSKTQCYAFTINNPLETDRLSIIDIAKNGVPCRGGKTIKIEYMIIGDEIGKQGTRHFQGFVMFKWMMTFNTFKKALPRARISKMYERSSAFQNYVYCSKDNNFLEWGNRPVPSEQGKRKDIDLVYETIIDKRGNLQDLINLKVGNQALRHGQTLLQNRKSIRPPGERKIFWLWGPTGSGRSSWVRNQIKNPNDLWVSGDSMKWFDEYYGQMYVLFDDFRAEDVQFSKLLKITDRYPTREQIKCGHTEFDPAFIFFTTPKNIRETFKNVKNEDLGQLLRRVTAEIYFEPKEKANKTPINLQIKDNDKEAFSLEKALEAVKKGEEDREKNKGKENSDSDLKSAGVIITQPPLNLETNNDELQPGDVGYIDETALRMNKLEEKIKKATECEYSENSWHFNLPKLKEWNTTR